MKKAAFLNPLIAALILLVCAGSAQSQTRIGDIVEIDKASSTELIGYGLVTGLDRTGDRAMSRSGSVFTVQSVASMLRKFDINVDPATLRTRNVAAVIVTATIGPYHAPGSAIDVTVSSLGDASSLSGGVLLQTPLIHPQTDRVFAYAQGALVTGGYNTEAGGARIGRNPTLTATIPAGAGVVDNDMYVPDREEPLGLIMRDPGFGNAARIVDAINERFEMPIASAQNAGFISVEYPGGFQDVGDLTFFTSLVLELEVDVEVPARVVINERTGTVVAGGNVLIGEVLISHGTIQIRSQVTPFVSQPLPFTGGETVSGTATEVGMTEESARNIVLEPNTTVADLATSLNNLGFSPRDIISIMQAIDRAGALKGKLIVM
ncbi:flagellar basal body P-ring protein FlgI [Rhodohalobacter mucosus]|uniref:Flagellar P-ring protein n=1 Tax=Rhodohalobacter mucosus TaxID=2079485 RepID=A0A316TPS1_9BACT|nr:flagellar basal body P-ring protein FlgI [Rhodohalobacter mucosus]PWN05199.1 flagellar biosynthesis protein FlgI [Rhodohalobacter mucosus]